MSKLTTRNGFISQQKVPYPAPALLTLGFLALVLAACSAFATPAAPTAQASSPTAARATAADTDTGVPPTATLAPAPAGSATASFVNDVLPILQSRCVNCHGGRSTEKGLALTGYDAVMAGSQNGVVVIAGNVAGSKLVQMIVDGKMPKRGPKLTPVELQVLTDWVTAGAQNN